MKREEAVALLKEIGNCCQNLSPDSISLVKAQSDNQFAAGYQLHIRMALDAVTVEQIQAIALKSCVAIHEETGEGITIYKPKTVQT